MENFNLNTVMTNVLVSGVLFFDSGGWIYYEDDTQFEIGNSFSHQASHENFAQFIERTVDDIMIQENRKCKTDENYEPLVTINYAIYCK